MRALAAIVPALGILTVAYRYFSAFIAARILSLDDSRVTPAHAKFDRANYFPTTRWVLFGHHFRCHRRVQGRWWVRCWRPSSAGRRD
jgi:carbon starvation protein